MRPSGAFSPVATSNIISSALGSKVCAPPRQVQNPRAHSTLRRSPDQTEYTVRPVSGSSAGPAMSAGYSTSVAGSPSGGDSPKRVKREARFGPHKTR